MPRGLLLFFLAVATHAAEVDPVGGVAKIEGPAEYVDPLLQACKDFSDTVLTYVPSPEFLANVVYLLEPRMRGHAPNLSPGAQNA